MTTVLAAVSAVDITGRSVVDEMAHDLLRATPAMLASLLHADGTPNGLFMSAARGRYADRTGGDAGQFLGDIAWAVLARVNELRPTS
ncbi:hypothetical protein ACFCWY_08660 [Streptomyces sp. NPDC056362]|uniref:hypothetical protein n=1 Tax=unclassified Streptomyces TaxID=2593676 RepID=UPI0035DF3077